MDESQVLAHVRAAAAVAGLTLDEARVQAVAAHFMRTAAMASLLDQAPLAPELAPAEIYRPAPFPEEDA